LSITDEPQKEPGREDQSLASPVPTSSEAERLAQALQEAERKAESYLANWQRSQADYQNYRKRVEQERLDLVRAGNAVLLAQLLPIVDDLERALQTADVRLSSLTWVDGVRLIYRKLLGLLETHGVKEVPTTGQQFDPRYHEAVLFDDNEEEGKILQELQKGYIFYDRVLRPAMVKVGRGRMMAPPTGGTEPGPAAAEGPESA
jgi:molecular chaperone GrpE